MPTTKKRVHITLPENMEIVLEHIAKRDKMPLSSKAVELLKISLELEEDEVLKMIAGQRDTKDAAFVAHEEAWK